MNRLFHLQRAVLLLLVLSVAGALLAQRLPDRKLVVNGRATGAAVLQLNGRSYVDVETLAQVTNGSVTFEPTQVVLTIPAANSAATPSPQTAQGLSRGFASEGIVSLAEMKEWRGALGMMMTFGLAVDGGWATSYRDRVQGGLARTALAATTSADHLALQMLNTQFANLAKWQSDLIAERQALNGARTVNPNALENDPVLTKFSTCARFLSAMLGSGVFTDNASCN